MELLLKDSNSIFLHLGPRAYQAPSTYWRLVDVVASTVKQVERFPFASWCRVAALTHAHRLRETACHHEARRAIISHACQENQAEHGEELMVACARHMEGVGVHVQASRRVLRSRAGCYRRWHSSRLMSAAGNLLGRRARRHWSAARSCPGRERIGRSAGRAECGPASASGHKASTRERRTIKPSAAG